MSNKVPSSSSDSRNNESRVLPLFIAGIVCFTIATALGFGAWSIFGSASNDQNRFGSIFTKIGTSTTPEPKKEEAKKDSPKNALPKETKVEITEEIEGILEVAGGEFAIGGGNTNRPIERSFIENFYISETEVTNSEYFDFVKDTGYLAPKGWKDNSFPEGQDDLPVTNVSWTDAKKYCEWLSKKYGYEVRLPTEAEWELAAGGIKKFKYPWGNDWNDEAAASKKTKGKLKAVKSYELNKSPFGAFDMVGNVWEWTAEKITLDEVKGKSAKKALQEGKKLRIAKGGSYNEPKEKLTVQTRAEIPQTIRNKSLGFRYVIIKSKSIRKTGLSSKNDSN